MVQQPDVPRAALELIKSAEGLRLAAYRDAVGVLTIGYGHTSAAAPPIVYEGMVITEETATAILASDVQRVAGQVAALLTLRVSANQFGALVSLAYNIGIGNFAKSRVLRKTNKGCPHCAAAAFALWVRGGGRTLPGLVKRRAKEAALYLAPDARPI